MRGLPLAAPDDSSRCQAMTIPTRWKRERKRDLRCPFYARFVLNDKFLCLRHAHLEALFMLLKNGAAKELSAPPTVRSPYNEVPITK